MKFQFGNVVVVQPDLIGVIVKSWADHTHDVYVREFNGVQQYPENQIKHYVYSKSLSKAQREFYD